MMTKTGNIQVVEDNVSGEKIPENIEQSNMDSSSPQQPQVWTSDQIEPLIDIIAVIIEQRTKAAAQVLRDNKAMLAGPYARLANKYMPSVSGMAGPELECIMVTGLVVLQIVQKMKEDKQKEKVVTYGSTNTSELG